MESVTIKGSPSGIERTIIKNASMKSLRIFLNVNWEKIFALRSFNSLIMYSSSTMNMNVAHMQPMKTKYLASMVVEF